MALRPVQRIPWDIILGSQDLYEQRAKIEEMNSARGQDWIANRLGVSKNSFYRYFKLLGCRRYNRGDRKGLIYDKPRGRRRLYSGKGGPANVQN